MKIYYSKISIKHLQKIKKDVVEKIVESIGKLPFEGDIKKMKGNKIKNIFRLRIGKYWIIYSFEKDIVKVIKIDTRGDVYKKNI